MIDLEKIAEKAFKDELEKISKWNYSEDEIAQMKAPEKKNELKSLYKKYNVPSTFSNKRQELIDLNRIDILEQRKFKKK